MRIRRKTLNWDKKSFSELKAFSRQSSIKLKTTRTPGRIILIKMQLHSKTNLKSKFNSPMFENIYFIILLINIFDELKIRSIIIYLCRVLKNSSEHRGKVRIWWLNINLRKKSLKIKQIRNVFWEKKWLSIQLISSFPASKVRINKCELFSLNRY